MDFSAKDDDLEPFFNLSSSMGTAATTFPNARRGAGDSKQGFDFSADDVLPAYDFQVPTQQQQRRSNILEQGSTSSSRRHRSSGSPVYLTGELFSTRKDLDMDSYNSVIVSAVERTIKKYADNILRVLEGMSGRLSQLESVTQVLERSVASLKASVDEYHGEADGRMRTLNNHVMEMHRAVQILRDKQDIIETHAELAKLQASKAEATVEKSSGCVSAENQTVVSLQTPPKELPNTVQAMSSTQLQVPLLQSNETVGQLQQLSLSPAVNILPQQYIPVQAQIQQQQAQQPHIQSQSELRQPLQPQELIQQSMQHALQAQPQHVQTQQSVQYQAQGLQSLPLQGSGQQLPQPQLRTLQQTPTVMPQSEQAQFQIGPQHLHMHQPLLQQAVGQPSVQVPHTQYVSAPLTLPAQTMVQPQQVQTASSPQLQVLQHLPPNQPIATQALVQPPPVQQNPNAQLQLQGVPPGQGSFQFAQHNESLIHAPLPQGALVQGPFTQVGYGVGPSYGPANTGSPQQHLSSTQSVQSAQHSNTPYQRNPMHFPGPQPAYASHTSGPITSPIANARALPVAQTVYNESLPGGPPNHLSHDGIIEKVNAMGFSRDHVRSVIRRLTDRGQFVDMNVVLDTLMNGVNQSQRGWQVR